MNCALCIAVILVLLVLLMVYDEKVFNWIKEGKKSWKNGGDSASLAEVKIVDDDERKETLLNDPKVTVMNSGEEVASTLHALGYTADAPWDQVLQATELDPSTFVNHMDFVKDVRRFSSGANFTSVTDDNTNLAFVNFRGLRRPKHVPIGPDARQQPDIDETVLQRNTPYVLA